MMRAFARCASAALLAAACCVAAQPDPSDPSDNDLRLLEAVKRLDHKAVESLARERAGLDAAQPDGATALAWAAHLDDAKMVDLLLAAGANSNTADEYGETPLTLACANGNAVLVDKLLKAGADA